MNRRPALFQLLDEAALRITSMGREAIAESHTIGHPAWYEDRETGRILREDPDGSRHFEESPAALNAPTPTDARLRMVAGTDLEDVVRDLSPEARAKLVADMIEQLRARYDPTGTLDWLYPEDAVRILVTRSTIP